MKTDNTDQNTEQNTQNHTSPTHVSTPLKNPPYINMSDEQRAECKRVFLETLGKCWNISMSCKAAGISRPLYDYWRKTDYLTQDEMDDARREWDDVIRGELIKVGIIGIPQPLIHNGRIALEPDGRKAFINKRDNRVLVDLASRYLPEWADYKDKTITLNTPQQTATYDGVPINYALVIDSRLLTPAQFDTIRAIAEDIEERERIQAATVIAADGE